MKRIILFFLISFCVINTTKASHMFGGEIRWECLSNGKFVFFLDVYKDCSSSAAGFNFVNQQLDISGGPLPRNSTNNFLNQITVKPDSNKWIASNNGDVTQQCGNPNGLSYSCASGGPGAMQWFPLVSDPIQLFGTPPSGGWTFSYDFCCRQQIRNLVSSSSRSTLLRTAMYRIPNPNGSSPAFLSVDVCQDSSPEFAVKPAIIACRGSEYDFSHAAYDQNIDSLTYSFDSPLDHNSNVIPYASGFSLSNQLPNQSIDSLNKPASLNSVSGLMNFKINNGLSTVRYNNVIRVDSWRCGVVIASTWRDMPIIVIDCAALPSGKKNNAPVISFKDTLIEVFAGELVEFDFSVFDFDTVSNQPVEYQKIIVEPFGDLFSKNFANEQFCSSPGVRPCATISPTPITSVGNPYQIIAKGDSGLNAKLRWRTDCNHAQFAGNYCPAASGVVSRRSNLFTFYFKVYDDNCPISTISYRSVSIRVKSSPILENPILIGASMGLDGKTTVSWVPPIDSANSFEEYDIDGASPNNGNFPSYSLVQSSVKNYQQDREFQFLNFPINLYTPFPSSKDYYFRMMSFSGCTGDVPSVWSDPVRIMELDAVANNNKSEANLTWNTPKTTNSNTNPNFIYESRTKYYIHENINPLNNDSLIDPNKWHIVGHTYSNNFTVGSPVCNAYVAYRVEARDTIITYEQGSRINIPSPKFDTLFYSTFSLVDSVLLKIGAVAQIIHDSLNSISSSIVSVEYQWYDCNSGNAIPNATSQFYAPTVPGDYQVKIGPFACMLNQSSACYSITTVLNDSVIQIDNQTLQGANVGQKFQWIDCRADTIIPGANNRTFIPSDTGYYAVIVSAYGYKDTSRCVPMIAIGLLENQFEKGLSVSPNPTTGELFIESKKQKMNQVRLFNLNGQLIQDFQVNSKFSIRINLEASQGIYLLEIENESGQKVYQKIVKQ